MRTLLLSLTITLLLATSRSFQEAPCVTMPNPDRGLRTGDWRLATEDCPRPPAACLLQAGDLSITAITARPAHPDPGKYFAVDITIVNRGPAAPPFPLVWKLLDSQGREALAGTIQIPTFPAYGRATVTVHLPGQDPDTYTLHVQLDVQDADPANNIGQLTIPIGTPPPSPTGRGAGGEGTPTRTPTPTATPVPTWTPHATRTYTPYPTFTPPASATAAPLETKTPTWWPTAVTTPTATPTLETPTRSPIATPVTTPLGTNTAAATWTPVTTPTLPPSSFILPPSSFILPPSSFEVPIIGLDFWQVLAVAVAALFITATGGWLGRHLPGRVPPPSGRGTGGGRATPSPLLVTPPAPASGAPVTTDPQSAIQNLKFLADGARVLIVGRTRSCKSSALHVLLHRGLADESFHRVVILDGKGAEFASYAGAADTYLDSTQIDQWVPVLENLAADLPARYARLTAQGLRKAPDDAPRVLIVIDEVQRATRHRDHGPQVTEALRLITEQSGALRDVIVLTTQRAKHTTLSKDISYNANLVVHMTGDGAGGYELYTSTEETRPAQTGRIPYVADEEVAAWASEAVSRRVSPPRGGGAGGGG